MRRIHTFTALFSLKTGQALVETQQHCNSVLSHDAANQVGAGRMIPVLA